MVPLTFRAFEFLPWSSGTCGLFPLLLVFRNACTELNQLADRSDCGMDSALNTDEVQNDRCHCQEKPQLPSLSVSWQSLIPQAHHPSLSGL